MVALSDDFDAEVAKRQNTHWEEYSIKDYQGALSRRVPLLF